MKILLDGYFDKNLGDDLMLELAAENLSEHEIYMNTPYLRHTDEEKPYKMTDIDIKLKVIGSGFLLRNYTSMIYRIKEMIQDRGDYLKAVLSCNISQYPNFLAEYVIKRQLSEFDFVTVRDTYSYEYIKKKLPQLKCEYYPDIVFSIPNDRIKNCKNEGALGISAYNSYGQTPDEVNLKFAEMADKFIEKTGRKVLLFALNTGLENDIKAAKSIKNMMKNSVHTEIIAYDGILDNIKRCSKMIGIRLHSVVLAMCAGVPVIPVAYSDKTLHMLNDLNFNGKIFEWKNIDFNLLGELCMAETEKFALDDNIRKEASKHIKAFKEIFC